MGFGYYVSEPNSYLVITGAKVEGVRIQKKALVLPFQKVTRISITPFEFSLQLHAMTSEKLKVCLPVVFTIGPQDDLEALAKYAVLLTGDADGHISSKGTVPTGRGHVQEIVKGIVEGETRAIVSNKTMMELFDKRTLWKKAVVDGVQSELSQFGLFIYNASIKELQDLPGSQYFEYQSKKAHEGVQNQAKVDVATARALGEIGEAAKQGETKREIAKINAHTALQETERKIEKAGADSKLKSREIDIERQLRIERLEAERAADLRDAELQKNVQQKKMQMELEKQRATTVTKAMVAKESAQEEADANLYKQAKEAEAAVYKENKSADAHFYKQTKAVEASVLEETKTADVRVYRVEKEAAAEAFKANRKADAALYTAEKEAQALFTTKEREAQAAFITRKNEAAGLHELASAYGALSNSLGGPQSLLQYLMLTNGTYERLAEANARAVHGLQPKINVWNTGAQDGADVSAPLRNIFQSLPPLFSQIHDQTGMAPPSWLAQMPESGAKGSDSFHEGLVNGKGKQKLVDGN